MKAFHVVLLVIGCLVGGVVFKSDDIKAGVGDMVLEAGQRKANVSDSTVEKFGKNFTRGTEAVDAALNSLTAHQVAAPAPRSARDAVIDEMQKRLDDLEAIQELHVKYIAEQDAKIGVQSGKITALEARKECKCPPVPVAAPAPVKPVVAAPVAKPAVVYYQQGNCASGNCSTGNCSSGGRGLFRRW